MMVNEKIVVLFIDAFIFTTAKVRNMSRLKPINYKQSPDYSLVGNSREITTKVSLCLVFVSGRKWSEEIPL